MQDASSIERVTKIVSDHLKQQPVVVVSAVGKTTDQLLEFAQTAAAGRRYEAWSVLERIQQRHFELAAALTEGNAHEYVDATLKEAFRTIHLLGMQLSEEGTELTPKAQDAIVSFGEQLSSVIVAAAFRHRGIQATQVDSRQLLLTDSRFTRAVPQYWETYARIRWTLPHIVRTGCVPVLGGFIAADEQGVTTTLGRGGSDLSASIIGAGVNAEEIQIWTDVDGMLTSDPRIFASGRRLTEISYAEAAALAHAGAKVLHSDTLIPAVKLRIPVLIRNSRCPQRAGTRISNGVQTRNEPVKSIACITNLDILEIRPMTIAPQFDFGKAMSALLDENDCDPGYVGHSSEAIFVGVQNGQQRRILGNFPGCTLVRLHSKSAVVTLVGDGSCAAGPLRSRIEKVLGMKTGTLQVLPAGSPLCFAFTVKQQDLVRTVEVVHSEFISHAECELSPAAQVVRKEAKRQRTTERLLPFALQPVFDS